MIQPQSVVRCHPISKFTLIRLKVAFHGERVKQLPCAATSTSQMRNFAGLKDVAIASPISGRVEPGLGSRSHSSSHKVSACIELRDDLSMIFQ